MTVPAMAEAAPGSVPLPGRACRVHTGSASHDRSLVLEAADTAPGAARAALHEYLSEWQLSHLEDDAANILSEIVANAATASQEAALEGDVPAAITVTIAVDDSELWLCGWDPDPAPPPVDYTPGTWDESGRGLVIVNALSHRWGTAAGAEGGKHVYATLGIAAHSGDGQPGDDIAVSQPPRR
jgi:anti-sigma regulatory factor (Ser/Thr protein kinase)